MTMTQRATIVFGGSSGIGRATVRLLARRGERVVVVTNDKASLAGLPDDTFSICADVTQADQIEAAVTNAAAWAGRLTGMVYSAGIQTYGSVVDTAELDWDRTIGVNLKGAYLAARCVIPHLVGSGGAIVNVSSVQAVACQNGVAAYAASKGGLNALSRAMALDHASSGIRVNAVCPGSVDTPMLRASAELFGDGRSQDAVLADWGRSHALGRIASADEVAAVIAFLLSDDASFVSGSEVMVDGGLTAALAVKADAAR